MHTWEVVWLAAGQGDLQGHCSTEAQRTLKRRSPKEYQCPIKMNAELLGKSGSHKGTRDSFYLPLPGADPVAKASECLPRTHKQLARDQPGTESGVSQLSNQPTTNCVNHHTHKGKAGRGLKDPLVCNQPAHIGHPQHTNNSRDRQPSTLRSGLPKLWAA